MAVRLTVPLVLQKLSDECWYASACMVSYYRSAGPRQGLPKKWAANKGIQVNDFISLAKVEGLYPIHTMESDFTSQQLETYLRNYGPIWCAGYWDGVGHIIVLTGIEGTKLFINDPNPARGKRTESLQWFNQRLARETNAMMYKK